LRESLKGLPFDNKFFNKHLNTNDVIFCADDVENIISGVTIQPRLYCVPYPDSPATVINTANNTKEWTFSTILGNIVYISIVISKLDLISAT